MKLFTIGFTKTTAEDFFSRLSKAKVKKLIDVRLNNVSQLAGFAKKQDLAYFLKKICGLEYVHLPLLAPTQEMLDAYRKGKGGWNAYAEQFLDLMEERQIERKIAPDIIADGCLLCSEDKPHHCHRRLVAEYLNERWGGIDINHLE